MWIFYTKKNICISDNFWEDDLFCRKIRNWFILTWCQFSGTASLLEYGINWHFRNNIIKLQSLVHKQFSSQGYYNLFRYFRFKSSYLSERSDGFESSVDFAYQKSSQPLCVVGGCLQVAVVTSTDRKNSL